MGNFDGNQGGLDIRTSSNNIVLSDGDGNPRGYFNNVGDFYVGKFGHGVTTAGVAIDSNGTSQFIASGNDNTPMAIGSADDVTLTLVNFHGASSTAGGSISISSGTSVSYNTSSDHRLKENVVELTGATTRLKQLAPKRFNFIAETDDRTLDGFLAHEVQSVVPEAVTGTHNEVDDDGNPKYQGIDQSKLVPLLVATIQELEARIAALESN